MISVIVPIYNVEKYLPRCLDNLINQTCTDVEFILIDDGSTDSSGKLADSYKDRDPRFRVFHTDNHGLSAARNYGIEQSKGEWLMFVDSDDWVSPSFCETPMSAAIEYNADLVVFWLHRVKNGKITKEDTSKFPKGIVSFEKAISSDGIVAWNKLYKKELFKNIRFPEGMVYEDVATTHKVLRQAERIAFIPDRLYYYVFRKTSISNTRSVKNRRDAFIASLQRYNDLNIYGYSDDNSAAVLCSHTIGYLIVTEPNTDPIYEKAEKILSSYKKVPKSIGWRKKILFAVWKRDKRIFNWICSVFGHRTTV